MQLLHYFSKSHNKSNHHHLRVRYCSALQKPRGSSRLVTSPGHVIWLRPIWSLWWVGWVRHLPPSSRTLFLWVWQCRSSPVRTGPAAAARGLSRPWSGWHSHRDVLRGQHLTILHTIRGLNNEWGNRQSVAPTMSISCRSALELVAPSELWDGNICNPSESSTKQPAALVAWVSRSCARIQITVTQLSYVWKRQISVGNRLWRWSFHLHKTCGWSFTHAEHSILSHFFNFVII